MTCICWWCPSGAVQNIKKALSILVHLFIISFVSFCVSAVCSFLELFFVSNWYSSELIRMLQCSILILSLATDWYPEGTRIACSLAKGARKWPWVEWLRIPWHWRIFGKHIAALCHCIPALLTLEVGGCIATAHCILLIWCPWQAGVLWRHNETVLDCTGSGSQKTGPRMSELKQLFYGSSNLAAPSSGGEQLRIHLVMSLCSKLKEKQVWEGASRAVAQIIVWRQHIFFVSFIWSLH